VNLLRMLALCSVASVLLVVGACSSDDATPSPSPVATADETAAAKAAVTAFYSSIGDKDGAEAYNAISKSCLPGLTQDQFTQAFNLGLAVLGDTKLVVDSVDVKVDGNTATADVKAKFQGGAFDGTPQDATGVSLGKEGTAWVINDCTFVQQLVGGGQTQPTGVPSVSPTGTP
jgi:hypothetical protein